MAGPNHGYNLSGELPKEAGWLPNYNYTGCEPHFESLLGGHFLKSGTTPASFLFNFVFFQAQVEQ